MNAAITGNTKNSMTELKTAFNKFRANPVIILSVAAAAAISIVVALLLWASSPDYRLLYSNINDKDAGAIVEQLVQQHIPYRFDEAMGAIMVPEDRVYETRLKLAQLGLPQGGVQGFELLDKEKFGLSQFNEQINYQRALEGELSRTIEILAPVKQARVHLALPKPSLFVREQKQPSASVTLVLIGGLTPEADQINAITHMVSSAVPGMRASEVTVVDQNGQLLTSGKSQAVQTSQLKYSREVEADYQQRILAILAPVVGADNVRAQVTAQFDFAEQEQTSERYQPNAKPEQTSVRSRQSSLSEQGGKTMAGGVPGALTNQPPMPASAQIETADKSQADQNKESSTKTVPYSQRNDETINYELDKTLTHTRKTSGLLTRLSVAVVVNYLPDAKGQRVEIAAEQLAQLKALAQEAMGYSDSRGDTLNIVNAPFTLPEEPAALRLWQQPEVIHLALTLLRYVAIALIAWVLWRKGVQPFWLKYHEMTLTRLELEQEARKAELEAIARQSERERAQEEAERMKCEVDSQNLRDIAERDPQIVALVVRQWLEKEQTSS